MIKNESELLRQIHEKMKKDMSQSQRLSRGNLDEDFATTMIPHHEGAVNMTRALFLLDSNTNNDLALRNLTKSVITTQPDEIVRLKKELSRLPKNYNHDPRDVHVYRRIEIEIMHKMHAKSDRTLDNVTQRSIPAVVYVDLMIPHHQAGADLARTYLGFGTNKTMKNIAQGIIAEQKHEIRLMKLWKKNHTALLSP